MTARTQSRLRRSHESSSARFDAFSRPLAKHDPVSSSTACNRVLAICRSSSFRRDHDFAVTSEPTVAQRGRPRRWPALRDIQTGARLVVPRRSFLSQSGVRITSRFRLRTSAGARSTRNHRFGRGMCRSSSTTWRMPGNAPPYSHNTERNSELITRPGQSTDCVPYARQCAIATDLVQRKQEDTAPASLCGWRRFDPAVRPPDDRLPRLRSHDRGAAREEIASDHSRLLGRADRFPSDPETQGRESHHSGTGGGAWWIRVRSAK